MIQKKRLFPATMFPEDLNILNNPLLMLVYRDLIPNSDPNFIQQIFALYIKFYQEQRITDKWTHSLLSMAKKSDILSQFQPNTI
jgi:hypothetical protein